MHAVVLHVDPRLVLGDALVDPVRLDQAVERLARQIELPNGRLHVPEDRPRRLAVERERNLSLQLVERREPVAVVGVTELVDQSRVAVERAHMRPQCARKQNRADREVLPGRPRSDLGDLHRDFHSASICCVSGGTDGIREDPVAGIDRNDGATVVRLAGELDLYNAHAVREALIDRLRGIAGPPRRRALRASTSSIRRRWASSSRRARGWRTAAASSSRRRASRRGARSRSPGSTSTSPCTKAWTKRSQRLFRQGRCVPQRPCRV